MNYALVRVLRERALRAVDDSIFETDAEPRRVGAAAEPEYHSAFCVDIVSVNKTVFEHKPVDHRKYSQQFSTAPATAIQAALTL
ncbi:MAG: hypothetical protein ACR2PG_17540 [Hyphomicrobiaceae bacterium]